MFARLDLMTAMLKQDFPDQVSRLEKRFNLSRKLYPWLDSIALEDANITLDSSLRALETGARIHRAARDPGGDAEVTAAIAAVDVALNNLLDGLLGSNLPALVAEVKAAQTNGLTNWLAHSLARSVRFRKRLTARSILTDTENSRRVRHIVNQRPRSSTLWRACGLTSKTNLMP